MTFPPKIPLLQSSVTTLLNKEKRGKYSNILVKNSKNKNKIKPFDLK